MKIIKFIYAFLRQIFIIGLMKSYDIDLYKYLYLHTFKNLKNSGKIYSLKAPVVTGRILVRDTKSDLAIYRDFFVKNDYVKTLPNAKVVIDAGSHIGCSVLYFQKRHPLSVIVAIEANRENYEFLKNQTESIELVITYYAALVLMMIFPWLSKLLMHQ